MGLLFRLAWRTLLARPTLALLAILLLSISTALLFGLYASVNVLSSLRGSLLNEIAIEIELSDFSDSTRTEMESLLKQRPDVLSIQSLSAREVLDEVERELGESLREVLTENPFPPIVRVKLKSPSPAAVEQFLGDVSQWPGVLQVVYPHDLWQKFENWIAALRGRTGYFAGALALAGWALVGLSLRAILRNRRPAWHLLLLLGLRPRELEIVQLVMELVIGTVAGLIAAALIHFGWTVSQWLLSTPLPAPTAYVPGSLAVAICLAVLAGIWAPRAAREI